MNIEKARACTGQSVFYTGGAKLEIGVIRGTRGTRYVMVQYAGGVKATIPEHLTLTGVSMQDARHVLWQFGEPEGWEPGSFTSALLQALQKADTENFRKLTVVYPGLAEAMAMAKQQEDGIEMLKDLIEIGRTPPDVEERKES